MADNNNVNDKKNEVNHQDQVTKQEEVKDLDEILDKDTSQDSYQEAYQKLNEELEETDIVDIEEDVIDLKSEEIDFDDFVNQNKKDGLGEVVENEEFEEVSSLKASFDKTKKKMQNFFKSDKKTKKNKDVGQQVNSLDTDEYIDQAIVDAIDNLDYIDAEINSGTADQVGDINADQEQASTKARAVNILEKLNLTPIQLAPVIALLATLIVNMLSAITGINGRTTGAISDTYYNLFTPAGLTFSIWTLIYILLIAYIVHQALNYKRMNELQKNLVKKINILFTLSSIFNVFWIIMWHYGQVFVSFILMIFLFVTLMITSIMLTKTLVSMSKLASLLYKSTFSIYFGWISIALLANFAALLAGGPTSLFAASPAFTAILVIIGAIFTIGYSQISKDMLYGLTVLWGYLGIFIKHISPLGFNKEYLGIILLLAFMIFFMIVSLVYIVYNKLFTKKIIKDNK